ncbi:hypothetical protein MTER_37520 [Mycolicibacter terrae]|uniref:DUF732 domain-containing protein n=1 Tax=Mycolicibacter terrae TaxID=1788 RepID=A0AAD1MIZ3_9MYCO|nr:DUF732 domain-containing protein [Mycolicibacter terrae]ORW93553.1 hypothetical protein AWC28_15820 [Mycolicibacter terrae]BBX24341.1 hypothetical protein MTER_37520 [Mycolicibacter terrae]SNV54213.1 Conserved exported protein of uncharacterised function (modular protein) [Mycolicibacter terrae]
MKVRKPVLAAFTVAGLLGLAAPAAAEPSDSGFLGALDQVGISYPNPVDAVAGGHTVCEYLASGHSTNQAAKGVKNANPSLTLTKAHQFVSIARSTYCAEA